MKNLGLFRSPFIFIALLPLFSCLSLASELVVGYPEFKPYTYSLKGQPKGIGIEALTKMNQDLKLIINYQPIDTYKNGITRLKHSKLDVLLLATKNKHRDEIAVFSKPIVLNKWSWFTLKGKEFNFKNPYNKKHLRITTYDNANTHRWLVDQNYGTLYTTTDVTAMLRQLVNERVDAIFLSEAVLLEALNKTDFKQSNLNITLEIAKPMGIYVNKAYLEKKPNFMERLNSAIESSIPELN